MRASSVLKTMAFWFVVPVLLVGAAGYTWLNMPSASKTDTADGANNSIKVTKRTYEPPAVEVNSKVGKEIKPGRAIIGKRVKRRKKTVVPKPDAPATVTPPVSEPPPTSMPVDGG
jgi:hypothetical protein